MRRVYVASSWRNERQGEVVTAVRAAGHEVYDFKNPKPGDRGFHWSEIMPDWQQWTMEEFRFGLQSPIATDGFASDWNAMRWADACILVMPCGRSAHLEAGYFVGADKMLIILLSDGELELTNLMAHCLAVTIRHRQPAPLVKSP